MLSLKEFSVKSSVVSLLSADMEMALKGGTSPGDHEPPAEEPPPIIAFVQKVPS